MTYQYPEITNNPDQYWWTYPYSDQSTEFSFNYCWWFTCPHCGMTLSWWSKFCPNCGKSLAEPPKNAEILKEIKKLLEEIQKKFDSLSETVKEERVNGDNENN